MEKMLNFTKNFHLKIYKNSHNRLFGQFQPNHKVVDNSWLLRSFRAKLGKLLIVLFLVLGFASTQSFAQRDEIITQAGEKIRCRILDETPTRFIYAYLSPTGKVLRNEIFKNLVTDFKYNLYPNDIATKGNKLPEGLGNARTENTAANNERVDTRKSESSKPGSKKENAKNTEISKNPNNTDNSLKNNNSEKSEIIINNENKVSQKEESTTSSNKPAVQKTESEVVTKNATTETKPKSNATKKEETKQRSKVEKKETVESKKIEKKVKEEKTEMPLSTKKTDNEFNNYLNWRVGARGGFGNMLAKIPTTNEYLLYQEKLLRGYTWGADAAYFFTDNLGFGLMFNDFRSKNQAENIKYRNEILNTEATGNISNNRSTKFIGPVLYYRKNIDFKTMVILGVSPGAYFYKDKGTYGDASYTFKGMDFGASATLGVDFLLGNDITGRDIILSLETGYSYGKMRALDFGAGGGAVNLATPIDLSRLDFTVGLRFTRYPRFFR
jgi:hypothetical protein